MTNKVPYIVLMLLFSTLSAWAKNPCYCYPIPESKTYQGEARKKHIIGYTIDWSCKYTCHTGEGQEASQGATVTGFYHEYFMRAEIGTEGICEGMVYKSQYNPYINQEVYSYNGETFGFKPSSSHSADLQKWAEANSCD